MKKVLVLVGVALCLGFVGGALFVRPVQSSDNVFFQLGKFQDAFNLVYRNSVDQVESQKLIEKAIKGMLDDGMEDPYAEYFPPKQREQWNENFQANYQGIGVSFRLIQDSITIIIPMIGGPSDRAGLQCNDKIVKINGENAVGIKTDSVPKRLKGPQGTPVTVTIKREGVPDLFDIQIIRNRIPISTVDASFMLENSDIGYVYLNRFAETTTQEVVSAAQELRKQGMRKLILDVRYNGGGLLDQAWRLADEFIPAGKTLVYTKARNEAMNQTFTSTDGGSLEDIPVVVLVNVWSASASEILAGALQDLDRALVVGETTFGKGLVQQMYSFNDGSGMKFTTAKYYTPSGRLIQREFKTKDEFAKLERKEVAQEGANLDHGADRIREAKADSARPTFKTLSGRTVYGGGGIVPDYVVKTDTLPKTIQAFNKNGILVEAVDRYILKYGNRVREHYKKNLVTFLRTYTMDNDMVDMMKSVAKEKKVEWNDEEFTKERSEISRLSKAFIAQYIWNMRFEFLNVYFQNKQFDKAKTLFPEAMKVAKLSGK